jgi:hypothetical protein
MSTPEQQIVVLVDSATLCITERLIVGCEYCRPDDAEIPFDDVPDGVTGNDPAVTDYIFVETLPKCPQCRGEIHEKTLVEID